jgi:formylglycine-generating enzyme
MKAVAGLLGLLLSACGQVLGAGDLEYSLGSDGGVQTADPAQGACAGEKGPTPVNIEGKFCIDSTEVTNAQFLEFLEAAPVIEQPPGCEMNVAEDGGGIFEPNPYWPMGELTMNDPVVWVDWCDAWYYCNWAGKRLCGAVGGGSADFYDYATTDVEFYYACSEGGKRAYPYGDTFDREACVTLDRSGPLPVESLQTCQGGYPGLFDMSGNVSEWQDMCVSDAWDSFCRAGTSAYSTDAATTYEQYSCGADVWNFRDIAHLFTGIRCCSDAR